MVTGTQDLAAMQRLLKNCQCLSCCHKVKEIIQNILSCVLFANPKNSPVFLFL